MNKFIADNYNRIFQRSYTWVEIQDNGSRGSTSERLIYQALKDIYNGTDTASYRELWGTLSADMLQRLADTPHMF